MRAKIGALISLTLISSCASLDKSLTAAATETGRASARVTLPDYPEDCRKLEPHASLAVGAEVRSILKRERMALDRANSRVGRCSGFYDDLRTRIK